MISHLQYSLPLLTTGLIFAKIILQERSRTKRLREREKKLIPFPGTLLEPSLAVAVTLSSLHRWPMTDMPEGDSHLEAGQRAPLAFLSCEQMETRMTGIVIKHISMEEAEKRDLYLRNSPLGPSGLAQASIPPGTYEGHLRVQVGCIRDKFKGGNCQIRIITLLCLPQISPS